MLKQKTIEKMDYCSLWQLLEDVAFILGNDRHKDNQELIFFWLSVGNQIKDELDKRLLANSDDDLEGEG